ncbi:MAG: protein kinase [Planctomycetes bacterium]|nr:protein kinase [Planctomycetota bacterium]
MERLDDLRLAHRLAEEGRISRSDVRRLVKLWLRLQRTDEPAPMAELVLRHGLVDDPTLSRIREELAGEVMDVEGAVQALSLEDDRVLLERLAGLKRYEIEETVASRAVSRVFRARDRETGERVALKVFAVSTRENAEAAWRFWEEILCCETVESPYVARLRDHGNLEGTFYYAMDYVEGRPIDLYVQERRPSLHEVVRLVAKVARGVAALHDEEILHRDLTPANVLVDATGRPVVIDLGVAKRLVGRSRVNMTAPGALLGTPRYHSPEQLGARPETVSKASDVWALGVLLYELAIGTHPCPGGEALPTSGPVDEKARAAFVEAMRARPPVPPGERRPGFPPPLGRILGQALSLDPAKRPHDARAFADLLEKWAGPESAGAPDETLPAKPPAPPKVPVQSATPSPRAPVPPATPSPKTPIPGASRAPRTPIPGGSPAPSRPTRRHGSSREGLRASASTADRAHGRSSAPRRIPSGAAAVTQGAGMRWIVLAAGLVVAALAGVLVGYAILGSQEKERVEVKNPEPLPEEPEDGEEVAGGTAPETDLDDLVAAIRENRHEDAERALSNLPPTSAREDVQAALELWQRARDLGLSPALGGSIDLVAGAARERLETGAEGGRLPLLRALAALYLDPALAAAQPTAEAPDLARRFRAADLAMALGAAAEPPSAEPFRLRGKLHLALGRPGPAASDLVAALGFVDETRDQHARRDTSALAAIAFAKAGETHRAFGLLDAYRQSADLDIHAARAHAYLVQGDLAGARREIRPGAEASPHSYLRHVLGRILYQEGDREGAAAHLVEAARSARPQDYDQPTMYFWAARVLHELGRDAEAAGWRRLLDLWHPSFEWEGRPAASYLE